LRGPGLATTDLSVEKSMALTSTAKLDVRAEAYNVLNRTNLNLPGFSVGAAYFSEK